MDADPPALGARRQDAVPEARVRDRQARRLDRLAIGLLGLGGACVATGLLPVDEAGTTLERVLPLLLFLGAVVVLAELTARAEVFDVVAARLAVIGGGSYPRLFLLAVALASTTTAVLNLDTTAVLLTPVMLALAARVGIDALPLAMTTVWLANTASLLLPVSNLTNLLAADRLGLRPVELAVRMAVPHVAAVGVTTGALWVFYWRRGHRGATRYEPASRHRPADPVLCGVAALACCLFLTGILADLPLGAVAAGAAAVVVVGFWWRDRGQVRPGLLPWRLLALVTGLFLVVQTVGVHGLDGLTSSLVGEPTGLAGAYRVATVGAGLSNALNNLPAYIAGEGVLPATGTDPVLALLVGTNLGPVVTPWASLATLLWYERCLTHGVRIDLRRFAVTGACLAVASIAVTVPLVLATC